MSSKCQEILDEWQEGCFYTQEHLAEAYCTFLHALLEDVTEVDTRAIAFLKAGFEAFLRHHGGDDPQATLAYRLALAMVGGSHAPPAPTTPQEEAADEPSTSESTPCPTTPCHATPRPTSPSSEDADELSTPESPQPGTSKRAREEDEDPLEEPPQPTLEVLETRERKLKRFNNLAFREEMFLVKGLGNELPSEDLMVSLFDTMLQRQREAVQAKDDDKVVLNIENSDTPDKPIWFKIRRTDQLNGQVVLDKLTRVLNSNQNFLIDGQLKIGYTHIPVPEAAGRRINRAPNETMDQWLDRKIKAASIFSPENSEDSMCLTRSAAVAVARGSMHRQAFYKMKQPQSIVQKKEAEKLCALANIDPQQPCGLDEIRRLQNAMPDFRLCVYTDKDPTHCVFKGPYAPFRKNVHILWYKQHFYAIFTPCQVFEYKFECDKCVIFYNHKGEHRCKDSCGRCFGPALHEDVPLKRCTSCFHYFAGEECFQNHLTLKLPGSTQTKCEAYKFCNGCETSYTTFRGRKHVCGFVYCKFCRLNVKEGHLCYMQPWQEKEKKENWNYVSVYYDIETTQCDPVQDARDVFEHKPNLLVSQAVCEECCHIPQNDYFCQVCKTRQNIFHSLEDQNINVISSFLDYLKTFPSKTQVLLIAHNAKSFDGIFILQELIRRQLKPELILQGCKIICMKLGNWKFIDSLMFLPMPLSSMPKSFSLNELKKGYWPYLANKPEYYNYEGPLLPKELYCESGMKAKAADAFNTWYEEQVGKNYVFNFKRELIDYCISDVTILRGACQAFRKLFNDLVSFDPMFHCMTLSAACMAAYRKNFMPLNKISIVPPGGYHGRGKQSHIALEWLDYESHKLGKKIQTILNDREQSVLGRQVDGYIELNLPNGALERRIYQFQGDYFHQCPIHYPAQGEHGENRYERTVRLTELFRKSGYSVVEMWECEWKRQRETDPDIKTYFQAHPSTHVPALNLRDALCGGRTSALRMHHKANLEAGETIKMVDVVSEYPNACLREAYPYGIPKIYLGTDTDLPPLHEWNGVAKCIVLPPRDLFLPVLPYKCNGKLMFPLCRTCAETQNQDRCCHEDPAQRQLMGTWCSPELKLAVQEKGYTLIKVFELYQYPGTMQYNPNTGEDGLLSAYIRCFMALKIQASGWPPECDTPEKKQKFVDDVKKYDGIVIDPLKMEHNPALRTLAKLILNSFWGKFGEKIIRSKTHLIYDYAELMKFVADPSIEFQNLIPLSDECLQLTCKPVDDSEESLPTSSLLIASFTTCFGRLQLYKYLDIVKERACYHDTDSVAFISRPGQPDLPLGTHLGDLTDQVVEDYGPGSFIIEFAAGGPKNYGYVVAVGGDLSNLRICIKVRGITINKSCDRLVTFEQLKAMVLGEEEKITVPIPRQIARLPGWRLVTRSTSKNWQAQNTKRRRVDKEHTVPYGYNAWANEPEEDQDLLEAMDILME